MKIPGIFYISFSKSCITCFVMQLKKIETWDKKIETWDKISESCRFSTNIQ